MVGTDPACPKALPRYAKLGLTDLRQRLRMKPPMRPNPMIIMPQVAGSGTALDGVPSPVADSALNAVEDSD